MNDAVRHTPGPWTIRVATASIPTIHVSSARGHLASVFGARHVQDARLIAAAPAMLEALKEAREQVSILQDRLGIIDNGHGSLSIINTAIARAIGSEG